MKWDDKGLAVAIAQNVDTGAVLMQGFVNRDALAATISTRKATFYSRSRLKLWTKGETSSNFINIHDIFLDCDRDSVSFPLLYLDPQICISFPIVRFLIMNYFPRLYTLGSLMDLLATLGPKLAIIHQSLIC